MNIIIKIREIKDLTPTERVVANYILSNLKEIVDISITDLAKNSYTSPSTVMRFINKLGVDSFTTFKVMVGRDMQTYLDTDFVYQEGTPFQEGEDARHIIKAVSEQNAHAILKSSFLNPVNDYITVAQLLKKKKQVVFYGIGESHYIANDAVTKALRLGIKASTYSDQGLKLNSSKLLTNDDLAVIISYTGKTSLMLKIANNLLKQGVIIISITSSAENQLSQLSTINFKVAATDSVYNLGRMSSRMSTLNVLDSIFTVYANKYADENKEILKMTYNYTQR